MFKLIIIFAFCIQQTILAPTLSPALFDQLKANDVTNVLLTLKDRPRAILESLQTKKFIDRSDRLNTVASTLKEFAFASQKNVLNFLLDQQVKKAELKFESLWTTNQIIVRQVDTHTLQELANLPEISDITQEHHVPLDRPIDFVIHQNLPPDNGKEIQWGVKEIQAPEVWASGNRGDAIIVATIDTGVRWTHEALKENYVGSHGWYDPSKKTTEPNDMNGHGTHVTANICGATRNVGVAPKSKWLACKGCATMYCSDFDLLSCGQFIACPTDPMGLNPDCSKAPHIVSNSWAMIGGTTWYEETISVWRQSGIIPIFSQGNSGPSCGSAESPADDSRVIGVGAISMINSITWYSSVGPTVIGSRIKPDVAAPGSNIFSAWFTSDTTYVSMSGTSMSCPHAAGTVALLLAENKNLNYDDIYHLLAGGTTRTISSNSSCTQIPEEVYPNHHVGHGKINALNSITKLRRLLNLNY